MYKLDTDRQVFFYEQEFYVLSNFSSFRVKFGGIDFDTAEHAYHFAKFRPFCSSGSAEQHLVRDEIRRARSAHDALQIARANASLVRSDWDSCSGGILPMKVLRMYHILQAKHEQHEYVRRKLAETGTRELVEDSWRDDFWGWGPRAGGRNMLGKLWMRIRDGRHPEISW